MVPPLTMESDATLVALSASKEGFPACLSKKHVAQAREQIRELVGEIRLVPMADGYLEAVLTGRYEGLLKLPVGNKLNNLVAGEGFEPSTFGL